MEKANNCGYNLQTSGILSTLRTLTMSNKYVALKVIKKVNNKKELNESRKMEWPTYQEC